MPKKAPAPRKEPLVTLDVWCQNQSRADRRVELIAGFHCAMRAAGRTRATEDEYLTEFQQFAVRPLK